MYRQLPVLYLSRVEFGDEQAEANSSLVKMDLDLDVNKGKARPRSP